ncbi:heavy metal-associated domain-containing protein [Duganella violaceipulchra]|uniref:Cation transport ATPase n=1 Tax=Duganella violaceipulchra TaxID=2849652 RepID=A0AA41L1V6_9BURK|nr:heavy metal-associated domain-containing protein [Duganella violaceicalia]MBV6325451.1 heavy-metal-associated domain-containing protein [Duganella violaceicalia]MCP2012648.1 cation transport ATPase [Duganella violaceicalia]
MLLASFTLKDSTNAGFGAEIEKKLQQLPGVSDVLIGDVNDTCSIVYDEMRISSLTLRNVLQAAGYDGNLEEIVPKKSSSCCGSCS